MWSFKWRLNLFHVDESLERAGWGMHKITWLSLCLNTDIRRCDTDLMIKYLIKCPLSRTMSWQRRKNCEKVRNFLRVETMQTKKIPSFLSRKEWNITCIRIEVSWFKEERINQMNLSRYVVFWSWDLFIPLIPWKPIEALLNLQKA